MRNMVLIKQGSEDEIQRDFFSYVGIKANSDERYKLIYAVPNGGKRNRITALRFKYTGLKPGVFDVAVDVPSGEYHGLKIEFKYGKNKMTETQQIYKDLAEKQGYKCVVCYSAIEAIKQVESYFKGE